MNAEFWLPANKSDIFMKHLSGYPYGETLKNISVSGFTLTETALTSILRLPKHSHEPART